MDKVKRAITTREKLVQSRGKFVTQEDYDRAEYIIYNNLSEELVEQIPEPLTLKANLECVKQTIKNGEKWGVMWLPYYEHLVFTSYGRMLNTKTRRLLKPTMTTNNVIYYCGGTSVTSEEAFKHFKWSYSYKKLLRRFIKNKWRFSPSIHLKQELKKSNIYL